MADEVAKLEQTVGRYMLFGQIGAGGMGAVHLGRRVGPAGFSRVVAIKRLHPHLAVQQDLVHAFLDEARIAARVSHPNVVSIDDVVINGTEILLVMEYVRGQSLASLASAERKNGRSVPPSIAATIAVDMLHGLQAAHEALDERGRVLGLVHRDVSPQNVLVGVDGVARVLDFGIAKALGRLQSTADGAVKGKLAYMAPERLSDREITASVDIYGAAIVIWELLAGERYFESPTPESMIPIVLAAQYKHLPDPALAAIDAVLEHALRREPSERHATCGALAAEIERTLPRASRAETTAWVQRVASAELDESAAAVADAERNSTPSPAPRSLPLATQPSADDAPATRPDPPPTRRDAPPRQDTSTQLTSEATVSDLTLPSNVSNHRARSNIVPIGVAAVVASGIIIALASGGLSRFGARDATANGPPSNASALPADVHVATTMTAATPSTGDTIAPASPSVSGLVARADARAKSAPSAGSRRPAAPGSAPSASASTPPKPPPEPDAPTDRK